MQLSIAFRHMDPTDAIKDLVEEKVSKVKKYIQGPFEASVVLSVERYLHACDVTITASGQIFKGREETNDMYTSVDKVMDKIERQIDKSKGRIRAGRNAEKPV